MLNAKLGLSFFIQYAINPFKRFKRLLNLVYELFVFYVNMSYLMICNG